MEGVTIPVAHVLPRWHSVLHRDRQLSFHAGTWCTVVQTALWQASVHASTELVPHTVTHVLGVASCTSQGQERHEAGAKGAGWRPGSTLPSKARPPLPGCPSAA